MCKLKTLNIFNPSRKPSNGFLRYHTSIFPFGKVAHLKIIGSITLAIPATTPICFLYYHTNLSVHKQLSSCHHVR